MAQSKRALYPELFDAEWHQRTVNEMDTATALAALAALVFGTSLVVAFGWLVWQGLNHLARALGIGGV